MTKAEPLENKIIPINVAIPSTVLADHKIDTKGIFKYEDVKNAVEWLKMTIKASFGHSGFNDEIVLDKNMVEVLKLIDNAFKDVCDEK